MKRTLIVLLLIHVISICSCTTTNIQEISKLEIWYDEPAEKWMTQALPIGNGYMGAMFFGGINEEQIQFSEGTLWSGGMDSNPEYNFGIKEEAHKNLEEVRSLLNENKYDEAHNLVKKELTGENDTKNNQYNGAFGDYGGQQTMGDLFVKVNHSGEVLDYKRSLDINNSMATVSYKINEQDYKRTYFASYPDRVLVYKFESTQPTSYEIRLTSPHIRENESFKDGIYSFVGKVADNKMPFEVKLKIDANGKNISIREGKLIVEETKQLIIVKTAATDYINEYPIYKGADYKKINNQTFSNIENKPYEELVKTHLADYKELFSRLSFKMGNDDSNEKPTDVRLLNYEKGQGDDVSLVSLYFQYARYLTISASRPGTLPMHLQGKWNNSTNPPWGCDYHTNINLQMLYWPVEMANLSECHTPLLDYIESLVKPGRVSAKEFFNTQGWIVNTMNNPFGYTSPGWDVPWGFFPGGAAWLCRHLWEHYEYTNDAVYLKEQAYPIMKEAALFWMDYLTTDAEGNLVSFPSYSPEHGGISKGASMDHQLAWDLLNNCIKASEVLSIDDDFTSRAISVRNSISPPKVGSWGQLQEWVEDLDDPESHHRHVSHLYALHPGNQISVLKTPELAEAAKTSLIARGEGGTGWSRAWKVCFWSRLHDGNNALKMLNQLLKPVYTTATDYEHYGGTATNLFCMHPPFQLDGNMGGAAGIAEMLVQSQTGVIDLLPALPDKWQSGSLTGIKVRGGHVMDFAWKNGKITKAKVLPATTSTIKVLINGEEKSVNVKKGELYVLYE